MYIQNGVKLSGQGVEEKIKLNYIEIPAILTYTFDTGQAQAEPYLMAGLVLGVRTSANVSANGTDADIKDMTKGSNMGGTFGAGVKFPAGMNKVFVEGRYTIGFQDVLDTPNAAFTLKTRGLAFFAGITFPFGL